MAENQFRSFLAIAALLATLSLAVAPLETSVVWAAMPMRKPTTRVMQPTAKPQLMETTPATVDAYAAYVQNKLQVEAMGLKQQGVADVKLTIGKDGTVRQTEVTRVEGAPALRDQIISLVNQMGALPPLPEDVDSLVVTATVATDYPSTQLYDRFGRRSR